MYVKKRNGDLQLFNKYKIEKRINKMINMEPRLLVDINAITDEVCHHIKNEITTSELDEFAAEICAYRVTENLDYDKLATRIIVSNNHKNSRSYKFSDMINLINENTTILSQTFVEHVNYHKNILDDLVEKNNENDYMYLTYFGYKTLEKSYLLKITKNNNVICERPQHLWMRVSLALNRYNIEHVKECYEKLSTFNFMHATPTLFNSGMKYGQLSSCFLMGVSDSIKGMYKLIYDCSQISKWAGGIGIWLSGIRAEGSIINSTLGKTNGIINLIKVLNEMAKHVTQGGRRKGSIAIYLEPWHYDVLKFLELKKNTGNEEYRARDLFYSLYVPDIFMKRIKQALSDPKSIIMWSLMCPYECPKLIDTYGDEFETIYMEYERLQKYKVQINILDIWKLITTSQLETSLPYIVYKDHVNRKSNQKNVGIIRSSNLCAEIVEYSDSNEYAVCTLGSLCLHKFVSNNTINYNDLIQTTMILTRNLNNTINFNYYPCKETSVSNFRHRPIAIGVQGLAELFFKLRIPYESETAQKYNKEIFEAIYYGGLKMSHKLALERKYILKKIIKYKELKKLSSEHHYISYYSLESTTEHDNIVDNTYKTRLCEINAIIGNIILQEELYYVDNIIEGIIHIHELQFLDFTEEYLGAYSTFRGSPASKGELQFDMWGIKPSLFDWDSLKKDIMCDGLSNSLITGLMPTATTAQITGSTEAFEPITSNIYSRSVLSGNFMIVNKYLQNDLIKLGLWNIDMKNRIIENKGSITNINEIPEEIKEIYKTAWEIKKKTYIKMSADRGAYIDQTQSLNLFIPNPDHNILMSCHIYSWECGLKTGMYYLRRKPFVNPIQFTIQQKAGDVCEIGCTSCSA